MAIRIAKIKTEICGEGKFTGMPTTFVYTTEKKARKLSIETIFSSINKMRNNTICIAGDEPLLQGDSIALVYELIDRGFLVNIHANCSHKIDDVRSSRSFFYTVEVKTPSSGLELNNLLTNLPKLSQKDEVIFEVKDIEDYMYMKEVIKKYCTRASILVRPTGNKELFKDLAGWIIEDKPRGVKLGIPIHKLL